MTHSELRFRALVETGSHSGDCDNCGEPLGDMVLQGVDGYYCTAECRCDAEDDDDTFNCEEDDAELDLDFLPG